MTFIPLSTNEGVSVPLQLHLSYLKKLGSEKQDDIVLFKLVEQKNRQIANSALLIASVAIEMDLDVSYLT